MLPRTDVRAGAPKPGATLGNLRRNRKTSAGTSTILAATKQVPIPKELIRYPRQGRTNQHPGAENRGEEGHAAGQIFLVNEVGHSRRPGRHPKGKADSVQDGQGEHKLDIDHVGNNENRQGQHNHEVEYIAGDEHQPAIHAVRNYATECG